MFFFTLRETVLERQDLESSRFSLHGRKSLCALHLKPFTAQFVSARSHFLCFAFLAMDKEQMKDMSNADILKVIMTLLLELMLRFGGTIPNHNHRDEEGDPEAPPVNGYVPRCRFRCRYCTQPCDRHKLNHRHHACQNHSHLRD